MRWRKLSEKEKVKTVYELVTDRSEFEDRIRDTNFDKFLAALASAVGGRDKQVSLIQKQIDVQLRAFSLGKDISFKIQGLYKKRLALGQPTGDLKLAYWKFYDTAESSALKSFSENPLKVDSLAPLFSDLREYYQFAGSVDWTEEKARAQSRLLGLVRRQLGTVVEHGFSGSLAPSGNSVNQDAALQSCRWSSLHPFDWVAICQSMLVLSFDQRFCFDFFEEKMALEGLQHQWSAAPMPLPNYEDCPNCKNSSKKLDINGFCDNCRTFFAPQESHERLDKRFKECCGCSRAMSSSSSCYCNGCGRSTSYRLKSLLSQQTSRSPWKLDCLNGCTLNSNGHCVSCDVVYTRKDSDRMKTCAACRSCLPADGTCSTSDCQGSLVTWQVHPGLRDLWSRTRKFEPAIPYLYSHGVRLEVPSSISDSHHFGHLAWQYCQFVASILEE